MMERRRRRQQVVVPIVRIVVTAAAIMLFCAATLVLTTTVALSQSSSLGRRIPGSSRRIRTRRWWQQQQRRPAAFLSWTTCSPLDIGATRRCPYRQGSHQPATRLFAATPPSNSDEAGVVVRQLQPISAAAVKKKPKPSSSAIPNSKMQLKGELREYRAAQAGSGKPLYTVFTNAVLDEIYRSLPTDKDELLNIKGIGPKKLDLYGDDILALVAPYASNSSSSSSCGTDVANGVTTRNDNSIQKRPSRIDADSLTLEQRQAAQIPLERNRNVFITGSAGTGKSHLLRYIVQELRQQHSSHNEKNNSTSAVGVCAPTGVAAIIVAGTTLHSYFGIGLGTGSTANLVRKVGKNKDVCQRIDETEVLVIDECSMLNSRLLEILDVVAREIRHGGKYRDEPFGGIRVVAFGDFFQLPPVHRKNGEEDWNWRPFAFDSPVWSALGLDKSFVELKQVLRQVDDAEFVHFLNKVRVGDVSARDVQTLNNRCCISAHHPLPTDGIVPTRLYALNRDVDAENESRLAALPGDVVVCQAVDEWRKTMPSGTKAATKKRMKDALGQELPDEVALKVGAQVMLTRNKELDKGLVNGSRGVVERFVSTAGGRQLPIVRFDNGITTKIPYVEAVQYNPDGGDGCIVRLQVPLKLAWALTIHKSQGATLTRALLDISRAFEFGQCYVALSRVQSLDGLWLEKPARLNNIMVSPQVLEFYNNANRT